MVAFEVEASSSSVSLPTPASRAAGQLPRASENSFRAEMRGRSQRPDLEAS